MRFWLPFSSGISGNIYTGCGGYEFANASTACGISNPATRRYGNAGVIGATTDALDVAFAWFPHTATGSGADIVVTTRDGVVHNVSLDGATTLGGVISAIESGTGNQVQVDYVNDNTRLRLRDTTGSGTTVFKVENAIGSLAASAQVNPKTPASAREITERTGARRPTTARSG